MHCRSQLSGNRFMEEGNDEQWAKMQANPIKDPTKIGRSVPVFVNGHNARELEYRKKAVMHVMEKWEGYLDPEYNEPHLLAGMFQYQMWSIGIGGLRNTGDFMVSIQGADGSTEMQMAYREHEFDAFKPFREKGDIVQSNMGMSYRPMEHFSLGSSGGIATGYDPYDPDSLAAARKIYEPGIRCQQPLPAIQLYQPRRHDADRGDRTRSRTMGAHLRQLRHWLQKVRNMLDPNRVADWSGYIPPEYGMACITE